MTGATGALGPAVAVALDPRVDRLVVRSPSRVPAALSGTEVRQASYDDHAAYLAAFEGVDVLLLVCRGESATRREEAVRASGMAWTPRRPWTRRTPAAGR